MTSGDLGILFLALAAFFGVAWGCYEHGLRRRMERRR